MRLKLSTLSVGAYVVPSVLALIIAPTYGYSFSNTGKIVVLGSAIVSVIGIILGGRLGRKSNLKPQNDPENIDNRTAVFLMLCGILAMAANFSKVGGIPLLSGGAGRVEMQSSILWNVSVLGNLGIFLHARSRRHRRELGIGKVLVVLSFLFSFLTAWKGAILLAVIAYASPLLRGKYVDVFKTLLMSFFGLSIFMAINYFRSEAEFLDILQQPIYYIIWGFVNFDAEAVISSTIFSSNCLHSVPFVGCKFSVENDHLIASTWNVFSALSPLYLDGGKLMVFACFFFISFLVGYLEKSCLGAPSDYVYFMLIYFFIMAHNAYSFYSASFFVSLTLLILLHTLRALFRR